MVIINLAKALLEVEDIDAVNCRSCHQMSETLIPQHGLRFVKRTILTPEFGDGVGREIRILQQRYTNLSGQEVWEDVPLVEDEEAGNG